MRLEITKNENPVYEIEEIFEKIITKQGDKSHVALPKKYLGRKCIIGIISREDQAIEEMEKETQEVIKKHLCKKCGGVIIDSMGTSMMAQKYGKICRCN